MSKKLKKVAAAMLAAALLVGCTACSAPAPAGESKAGGTESKAEGQTESTAEGAAAFNETGYPIVNEPVTLKVLASKHGLSDPYPEQKVFQDLEQKTNIKVEWQYAEGEDWQTQKPLLLASGELPDVFLGSALNESDVSNNSELFLDMTEYIDKYGPNIQAMFTDSPAMKSMATAFDGKIYGLPHQMPCRPVTFDLGFINQKWLDNLNLKMPTTTDEFETVLKAFKEQDANGNGDPSDELPMTFMGFEDLTGCLSLYGSFGADVVDNMTAKYLSITERKVQYIPVLDNFKEGTKWLAKLFSQGLIDIEAFTNDWTTYPAKLNPEGDDKVGVGFHWSLDTGVGPGRSQNYKALMPLKGPKGDQYWRYNPDFVQAGKCLAEITTSCKTPEIALRWLDAMYDPEVSMQLFYGAIGVTMEKNDDGKYLVKEPPEGTVADTWAWKYSMGGDNPGYCGDTFSKNITPPKDIQAKLAADEEYSKYLKPEYYPMVTLTKEQLDELSTLGTDLNNYFKETVSGWIVNGGDIEAEWPGYVDKMKKMGADRYAEIYQQAYDSYTK